jgi:hypothetical protein
MACESERLLGVSITGYWDCPRLHDAALLREMRDCAVEVNREFAQRFGLTPSTAVTCIKPSGTVSELVDASPGIHPRYARHYLRRIRISSVDPLFRVLEEAGLPYVPDQASPDGETLVFEFPVRAPREATVAAELTALDQLESWRLVKRCYTEHNPSVTVRVKNDEWLKAADWVYGNWDIVGGLTFIPADDHAYENAPFARLDAREYEQRISSMPQIDFRRLSAYEHEDMTSSLRHYACVGGACEIL